MLYQVLSLTALLSFLSLGLMAEEEVSSVKNTQEIQEPSQEEKKLACACKKKKNNRCNMPRPTDEENKSA